jgi:hypothetical protein
MERTRKHPALATPGAPGLCSAAQQNGSGSNTKPNRQQVQLLGQLGHRDADPDASLTVPSSPSLTGYTSPAVLHAIGLLQSGKSVREVAAATGLSKSTVGRLRAKQAAGGGTPLGQRDPSNPSDGVSQAPCAPPLTKGRGFDRVPEINSLWFSDLIDAKRSRFVDGVGLWNLFLAAPEDHREAFLDRLRSWLRAEQTRIRNPAARSTPGAGFPDLPDFLDRRRGGRS